MQEEGRRRRRRLAICSHVRERFLHRPFVPGEKFLANGQGFVGQYHDALRARLRAGLMAHVTRSSSMFFKVKLYEGPYISRGTPAIFHLKLGDFDTLLHREALPQTINFVCMKSKLKLGPSFVFFRTNYLPSKYVVMAP